MQQRKENHMAKKGMKRPEPYKDRSYNEVPPVPELQGKAKHTKEKANPIEYNGKRNTTFK